MRKLQIILLVISVVCFLSACKQDKTNSDMNSNISQIESSESQNTVYAETEQPKENNEPASTNQISSNDEVIEPDKPKQPDIPIQPSDIIDSNESTNENTENSVVELTGINKLRVDYNLGTCRNLSGKVSVILLYMDDFESKWTDDEIANFTNNEVKPGLTFLEKEAKSYGIELDLSIKQSYSSIFYDDEVILSVKETGLATIDVLEQAAQGLNYSSDEEMIADFKSQYGTEIVCFTIFNKNGTAYAINPHRGENLQVEEHCIIFAHDLDSKHNDPIGSQSSIVAHEMLHLFGAEDFYATANRKALARKYYPRDIMLGANYYIITNNIGEATAFYIGWSDKVPDILYDENW